MVLILFLKFFGPFLDKSTSYFKTLFNGMYITSMKQFIKNLLTGNCPGRGCSHLLLAVLHWLRVPQRVDFKIAVMAFRVLHGLAPPYLDQLVRVADLPGRRLAAYVHQRHTS